MIEDGQIMLFCRVNNKVFLDIILILFIILSNGDPRQNRDGDYFIVII